MKILLLQSPLVARIVVVAVCLVTVSQGRTGFAAAATPAARVHLVNARWPALIPPTGAVNPTPALAVVASGQRIALTVLTSDATVEAPTFIVTVEGTSQRWEIPHARRTAARQLKAQGLDAAVGALRAGGVGEKELQALTTGASATTLHLFAAAEWTIPEVADGTVLRVAAHNGGGRGEIEPARVTVRSNETLLREPGAELDIKTPRFHAETLSAQRIAWWLATDDRGRRTPPLQGYFVAAAQADTGLAETAVWLFPSLNPKEQRDVAALLASAGRDVARLLPGASVDAVTPPDDPRRFPALADPVRPESIQPLAHQMDRCWGAWMATGDRTYLWALVEHLVHAADHEPYQRWAETKGGAAGLNAPVARGLLYHIAGWSLGSFLRTDPLVADWLGYWQQDPAVAPRIREQLASLATNPAFRRAGK